jgi:hypothetical protein
MIVAFYLAKWMELFLLTGGERFSQTFVKTIP